MNGTQQVPRLNGTQQVPRLNGTQQVPRLTRTTRELILIAAYVLAGTLGAGIAGLIGLGTTLFTDFYFLLNYLIVGFAGGLIYAALRLDSPLYAFTTVALLWLGFYAFNPPLTSGSMIDAAIRALATGGGLVALAFICRRLGRIPFGKFLLFGLILGLATGVGALLVLLRQGRAIELERVIRFTVTGLRVGALIGLGMEIIDFVHRLLMRRKGAASA